MNWFDTSGLTSLAKNALKEAQKTIDKALDIQEHDSPSPERSTTPVEAPENNSADFLSSWGLTTSGECEEKYAVDDQPITESPSKNNSQSLWGSFAGSFFEPQKTNDKDSDRTKEKTSGSQDDLFSGSKLVVSEGDEASPSKNVQKERARSKTEEGTKFENAPPEMHLNRLSFVSVDDSGKNSSDSVEVLGSQMTTPDSEVISLHSASNSSSAGLKPASESVEILPDSLVSPSIECVGFDSCDTRTECSSANVSPLDDNCDKFTPTGDCIEAGRTGDSVSLVADEDEDTISYNSVSECTAPTILDTHGDDKYSVSLNPRLGLRGADRTRLPDIKDTEAVPTTMVPSDNYASSNDGSWSDRTLNADNDSIVEANVEEKSKQKQSEAAEETYTDRLSDSSSFYNVNMAVSGTENANFAIEKSGCRSPSESSKDKERVSPISSESRSELVKIGSDRTSTHTSGDELETGTSSDIEIIPSPNGDGSIYCRSSPSKYAKGSKDSSHLVDLVLGKSLATKIRGHNRELSEASIQSNTSDESHSSENERLIKRLCEMTELLDAKDVRLAELNRVNCEFAEKSAELKSQLDSLRSKHEAGEFNLIAEDYAQRMSALEKKFQQVIREKDVLRKQMDTIKSESSVRRTTEMETLMKEKDEMIAQLQEEGEKLSKQQFTQSNIIKKLRVKEKENEQVIKSLRDKIAEQTSELDRLKRSISAKEELEVTQIEAIYKLTNSNKKLESDLQETRSTLDDTIHKLSTTKTSLEAARKELVELQKSSSDMKRRRDALAEAEKNKQQADLEVERLTTQLENLRAKMVHEECRWASREEALRRELGEARAAIASLESRVEGAATGHHAALLAQLAALQHSALERDRAHTTARERLARALDEAERASRAASARERATREELAALQERLGECESARGAAELRASQLADQAAELAALRPAFDRAQEELKVVQEEWKMHERDLERRLEETERLLREERAALDVEKRRSLLLQEQVVVTKTIPGDVSPSHSLASDTLSASLWTQEEGSEAGGGGALGGVHGLEEVLARLQRRDGEVRTLSAAAAAHQRQLQALRRELADTRHALDKTQGLQEQYDTLLQMYGEKEEQTQELRLDLQDVTTLYKSQLDEIIALKRRLAELQP